MPLPTVIVENQMALADTFAARAVLLRLMAEGSTGTKLGALAPNKDWVSD